MNGTSRKYTDGEETMPAEGRLALIGDEDFRSGLGPDDYRRTQPGVSSEEIIAPYFKEMRHIPLLKYEDEQRLGKSIQDAQNKLLNQALKMKTDFVPLRSFQKQIRDWRKKQKNSREPIETIMGELDRVLELIDGHPSPSRDLTEFADRTRQVREEMNQAMGEMVQGNLRLAVSIAKRYARRGMPLPDLIQEGNLGLMKAVARFDYTTGNRFSTFASWWIRQTISRALSDQGRTIRVPVHFQEIRSKFYRAFFSLVNELGREPTPAEIAERSGLSGEKILTVLQMNREPLSLDTPVTDDGDCLADLLECQEISSPQEAAEETEMYSLAELALGTLSEREQQILSMRFGLGEHEPCTLEEVGAHLNISRERVRQLEKRAMSRLRHNSIKSRLSDYFEG